MVSSRGAGTQVADLPCEETLDARVAGRLERQQILSGPRPPMVSVVLAEAVLRRCVAGPDAMRDQLARLAEAGRQPRVTVQVIPAGVGAHAGLGGAVAIADTEAPLPSSTRTGSRPAGPPRSPGS